jgi:UDP-MurNAc hydroxylase
MKFTILGHACMYVEANGTSILIDPWVIGSCYWRSWWNFPEPDRELVRSIKPDYIYITHLHWDHFHGPSLHLFDPDTKILVPRAPTTRMVDDLRMLKFHNIHEIPHGSGFELAPGFRIHSYQFGPVSIDSAAILTDGERVLFDANDCKLFGRSLRHIQERFPKIDFVFRSHSSANPFPYCIEDYKTKFPTFRTKQDYIEEFTYFGLSLGARYAIPFASNHCFLHRETIHFNETAVLPNLVQEYYNATAAKLGRPSECVVMPPGSSWSDTAGFNLVNFDYSQQQKYVAYLGEKYREKLARQYAKEERVSGSFSAFSKYFQGLFATLPAMVRRLLMPKVIFRVKESRGERLWLLDGPAGKVREIETLEPCDFIMEVAALVINDCSRKRMFSTWTPSKRVKIVLQNSGMGKVGMLLNLLDYYENDGLPFRRNFSSRQMGIRIKRWREPFDLLVAGVRMKMKGKDFKVTDLYPLR